MNAPGCGGLDVQRGDSSILTVPNLPNPETFPGLADDHERALVTELQWIF